MASRTSVRLTTLNPASQDPASRAFTDFVLTASSISSGVPRVNSFAHRMGFRTRTTGVLMPRSLTAGVESLHGTVYLLDDNSWATQQPVKTRVDETPRCRCLGDQIWERINTAIVSIHGSGQFTSISGVVCCWGVGGMVLLVVSRGGGGSALLG